jgi:acyl-CoA reductase-like NAD-dependent aldehyde dehydrogenase
MCDRRAILIGSEALQGEARFSAVDPATGATLEPSFSSAGTDAVAEAAALAEAAFPAMRRPIRKAARRSSKLAPKRSSRSATN